MAKIKPFDEPTFTQVSNFSLDHLLPIVSPAVWKILSVVIRKTRGWHKNEDELSLSQFMTLTGMTKPTVIKAIKEATKAGYLIRRRSGRSYKYRLNTNFEIDISKDSLPSDSKESLPSIVKEIDTQKKGKEKTKENNLLTRSPDLDNPPDPESDSFNEENQDMNNRPLTQWDLMTGLFGPPPENPKTASTAAALARSLDKENPMDLGFVPESLLELAQAFYESAGAFYLPSSKKAERRDISFFDDWRNQKITPPAVREAVITLRNKNYDIAGPQSITNTAKAKQGAMSPAATPNGSALDSPPDALKDPDLIKHWPHLDDSTREFLSLNPTAAGIAQVKQIIAENAARSQNV